jgi:hypothetical protein
LLAIHINFYQRQTGHCGNAAIATRLYFLRKRGLFLKNAWKFKDIFSRFEAFLNLFEVFSKISILFEGIFKELEAFYFLFTIVMMNSFG